MARKPPEPKVSPLIDSVSALVDSSASVPPAEAPPEHAPIHVYVQNGPWGKDPLGNPTSDGHVLSIGAAGCLLTCLSILVGFLRKAMLTPPEANVVCIDGEAFSGPLLIVEKAAHLLGLKALESERFRSTVADQTPALARAVVDHAFANGKVCILHVDINTDTGGDKYGDHFVVAFERRGDVLFCGDPAPGKVFTIDLGSMEGHSTWIPATAQHPAVVKHMRVVGVIPVSLGDA